MRAIQFTEFGGPEVLHVADLPEPHPAAGQIRVRVRAVGINPIDWKVRSGMMGGELPKVTGQEVSGVVDELGDGVSDVSLGDEVFGPAAGGGGAAEYALVGELGCDSARRWTSPARPRCRWPSRRPRARLTWCDAGEGQTVLVNGAAGAVGIATVQLARERGARVIGTASPGNHEYLRSYGAEPTTYGDGLVERVRAIAPDGVDRAIDAAGGGALPALVELAGGPANVVTIADYEGAQQTGVTMTGGPDSVRAWYALAQAAELIEAGRFSLPVAQTFALEQIADGARAERDRARARQARAARRLTLGALATTPSVGNPPSVAETGLTYADMGICYLHGTSSDHHGCVQRGRRTTPAPDPGGALRRGALRERARRGARAGAAAGVQAPAGPARGGSRRRP